MSIRSGFARLAVLAAVAFGAPASAFQITGLSVVLGGTNSANDLVTSGQTHSQVASSTSIVFAPGGPVTDAPGSTTSFLARYASLVAIDRQNTSGTGFNRTLTSAWQITFTVDNPTGGNYQIEIDTSRLGALTNVTDSTGNGTGTIGAVTGRVDGNIESELALAAVGPFSSTATAVSVINQSSTTLTILDSAPSRTIVLSFDWTGTVGSAYDEAAIRLGLAGSLSTVTADDYPGVGSRVQSNDGHFVDVTATLLSVPEPEPLALLALGLLGLASASRRARSAGTHARR